MCGETIPNITLALPEDVYEIVKLHSEIRWSEIARRAIESYAKKLAMLDAIISKSELTEKDVMEIDKKVKEGIYKRYMGKKSHASGN
jgi:hypothetical protein